MAMNPKQPARPERAPIRAPIHARATSFPGVVGLLLLACGYDARFQDGLIRCGANGACPESLVCVPSGVCCATPTCAAPTLVDAMESPAFDGGLEVPAPPPPLPADAGQEMPPGLSACTRDDECASAHCVGGVCCDQACTDACQSCLLPGKVGRCSPKEMGTACGEPACGTMNMFTAARSCNGRDTACPSVTPRNCGGFVCTTSGCKTVCTADADCQPTHTCSGRSCVLKFVDGVTCSSAKQCASGVCNTYYTDNDGDGYGVTAENLCGAVPAKGFAVRAGDCCDLDVNVRPGQTQYFDVASVPCKNTFDYNCSGFYDLELTAIVHCTFTGANDGWSGPSPPGCGEYGAWQFETSPQKCPSITKRQRCH
jgi:hypothetical protein